MNFKKILIGFLLILVVIVGGVSFFYGGSIKKVLMISTGYSAKVACSCVYVSGRTMEDARTVDLQDIPLVSLSEDKEAKTLTASMLGIYSSTAYYREGSGCTLLRDADTKALDKQKLPTVKPSVIHSDTALWPIGNKAIDISRALKEKLDKAVSGVFSEDSAFHKTTRAVAIFKDNALVYQKYAEGFDLTTPLLGWSMTKSVSSLLIGLNVKDEKMKITDDHLFEEWKGDERSKITLEQLLHMASGLDFNEDYGTVNDVTELLFIQPSAPNFSLKRTLLKEPGSEWYYSSATSNLLTHKVRKTLNDEQAYVNFPYERLFYPIGMNSAVFERDASGNFVGSSFLYANTLDWGRLGQFMLNKGIWQGDTLLTDSWIDDSIKPFGPSDGAYGYQIWLNSNGYISNDIPQDIFYPSGYEGQNVFVIPSKNMVIVRLGLTKAGKDYGRASLIKEVLAAFE